MLKGAEELVLPKTIIKRDGRVMSFDAQKIEKAITKCFASLGADPNTTIPDLTRQVINAVAARYKEPTVEQVQDVVEMILQAAGEFSAAKHYILYRAEHAKLRETRPVPEEVRAAFEESEIYFPSQLQKFQFFDKYSRFSYDVGRRETWKETVDRALSFLHELAGEKVDADTYKWISRGILEMKAAPSMRLLAMAGPAAGRNNIAIYNCSYLPIDSVDSFVEPLLISMNGCGVGFSVESKYVENLPRVRRQTGSLPLTYSVADTTEGWSDALRVGLSLWFEGGDIKFDYSQIRPAGAILKTKGGRASGPEPLKHMLEFVRARLLARQGSFLRPLDAHDIVCEVGNAAVSGGMRRTAMISLFDWDDAEMRDCKNGDFERENSQRWNANNSAVWPDRGITQPELVAQMLEMVNGGRGEPGIFNRQSAISLRPARRAEAEFGTNPCGEIVLRPYEFCNLSIAIARQGDSYESLSEKVELAAVIGTIQALATNFPGLRPMWKQNCQEERLVGVDITGQLDSEVIQNPAVMSRLRQVAVETNRKITQQLGINQAASVTCVKPSGNSSQLFDCASGLHARWSSYYVRNVRVGTHTPMFKVLQDSGVPMDPENGQSKDSANTWVAHFPVKSPEGAVVRKGRSAIRQCEYWLQNKIHWTEHNPSVTITYHPDEVIELIKWVWEHRDMIGGMSFLPAFDAKYAQMPFEEVDRETYEALAAKFPNIDFSKLYRYEEEDYTKAAQELACIAGACEIEFVPDGKGGEIAAQGVS
ncbi:recombinase [Candidatus Amesbacteria bacterium RIFCSPHIGHO2_01_FULL_47_34]|nr:MAG: recombinase [Candidatus Amesbacteria bacterium RIFCSPHIGHO2_01_FULL_47_34]